MTTHTTPMSPDAIRAALDAEPPGPIELGCACDGRPGHTDPCLRDRLDLLTAAFADDLAAVGLLWCDGRDAA